MDDKLARIRNLFYFWSEIHENRYSFLIKFHVIDNTGQDYYIGIIATAKLLC